MSDNKKSMKALGNDWDDILKEETQKEYFQNLRYFLGGEYKTKTIYPPKEEIFSALIHTSYADTKVVILGQDPYINAGEAHGMAFSVKPAAKVPPSLKNIFKELESDIGKPIPPNGYLLDWAKEGVLLLNTVLTVERGKSKSHANLGWEKFTTYIIQKLDEKQTPLVFLLWGNDAKRKKELIDTTKHKVLEAVHPSPLAGGKFFGCRHFSKANEFLLENNIEPIKW